MKERPILFSGAMVCAILEGRKTQTRRAIKFSKKTEEAAMQKAVLDGGFINFNLGSDFMPCPYGQPGDRLWVRETFYAYGRWETRFSEKKGRDEWYFIDLTIESGNVYHYAAEGPPKGYAKHHDGGRGGVAPTWYKRPSLFMPRAASRITLEITSIRSERLNEISEADAIAEGIELLRDPQGPLPHRYKSYTGNGGHFAVAWASFKSLWESINGAGSFGEQWVWVIEFKMIQP